MQNLVDCMNGRIWEVLSLDIFSELEVSKGESSSTGEKQHQEIKQP